MASATGLLVMKTDVSLYGGFAGCETQRSDTRYKTNIAISDGANGRDTGIPAYHVIMGADNATRDGFVVQNGNASGGTLVLKKAGGMDNTGVSKAVRHCAFHNNRADALAGAMINSNSSAVVEQSIFHDNNANRAVSIGRISVGIVSRPWDAAGVRQMFQCA